MCSLAGTLKTCELLPTNGGRCKQPAGLTPAVAYAATPACHSRRGTAADAAKTAVVYIHIYIYLTIAHLRYAQKVLRKHQTGATCKKCKGQLQQCVQAGQVELVHTACDLQQKSVKQTPGAYVGATRHNKLKEYTMHITHWRDRHLSSGYPSVKGKMVQQVLMSRRL